VRKSFLGAGAVALAAVGLLVTPVGGGSVIGVPGNDRRANPELKSLTLSAFSEARPNAPLRLLFIHHSVGGRLLADAGAKEAIADEIWRSHPEGGGLRRRLEGQGYEVNEASYGSSVGADTDFGDWLPKFRDKMDSVLTSALNEQRLPEGRRNQVIVWKSCFPNNQLADEAAVERARANLAALLPIFAKHPEVLFVHLSTPPLAPMVPKEPAWRWLARALLRKPQPGPRLAKSGAMARALDDWVTSPDGWLKNYPLANVAVFDLYDVLTGHGKSNLLVFPTGGGYDSHPSREGNERAAAEFVPFLNRAVRRAGLSQS
jgi:hypothetical protein